MLKELIVALICVVTFNHAARVPHGEPIKKQVAYSGYNNVASTFYQDPSSQFYSAAAAYPQSQGGVVGQGQIVSSTAAGTTGVSVKQSIVPPKSVGYPVANSVATQFASYPFKQYYPQIYPQNSQYPSVPSVFYVPSQGRYPQAANEAAVSQEGTSVSSGSQGGGPGSWFSGWNQVPSNWQTPQLPQLPQGTGNYPSFPSIPNYPANLPQFPAQFPSQFPSQLPQFPSNFPSGNFPAFPGNSPANAVPTGASPTVVPGSEAVAGATTNGEGQSVVVVSARRPEKIENVDSNVEGVKNEIFDKVAADFPAQQYYLLQPSQYLLSNGGQVPVVQTAGGKDPAQLDGVNRGAISSFLFQQQQPVVAQPAAGQQYSQISQNKLYSPQEFQELLQQVQVANKKLIESNGGGAVAPQFYYQQGVPQQGFVQQGISSQGQSQDVSSQQGQGAIAQQYLIQGAQPVQPYVQFAGPNRQIFVPQFASLPQQKPIVGEISNVPGAAVAYQRFLLENQKPIKSSFVGVQGVDGTVPVPGAVPTPVSIPSVSSSLPANDSTSSPEPINNVDSESTGSSADKDTRNEANEIPFNDIVNVYQSTIPTPVDVSSGSPVQVTKPNGKDANDDESSSTAENTYEQNNLEFGARLNIVKPNKAQKP